MSEPVDTIDEMLVSRRKEWRSDLAWSLRDAAPPCVVALALCALTMPAFLDWSFVAIGAPPTEFAAWLMSRDFIERFLMLLTVGPALLLPFGVACAGPFPTRRRVVQERDLAQLWDEYRTSRANTDATSRQ